jgi:hypothetical protein
MNIHIPKEYLWYGGLAIAAGLAYWYLKSNGYWDTWFNAQGNVIPVGPQPVAPVAQPSNGFQNVPGFDQPVSGVVN